MNSITKAVIYARYSSHNQREEGVRPEEVYPYKALEDDHRWTECSGIPAVDFVSLASKGRARFFKA